MTAYAERVDSGKLLRRLPREIALSAFAKFGGAALSYFMMILIARHAGADGFGVFGASFSLAILLAFVCCPGQYTAVLRFEQQWTADVGKNRSGLAIKLGLIITSVSLAACALLLVAATIGGGARGVLSDVSVSVAVAALLVVYGLAEYSSAALRSRGNSAASALFPRDLVWRILCCSAVLIFVMLEMPLSPQHILWLLTALLFLSILPQLRYLLMKVGRAPMSAISGSDWKQYRRSSGKLWAITLIGPMLAVQLGVVIVGSLIGAREAGSYFAAERTAYVLSLSMAAVNLVAGPLMARYFYAKDTARLHLVAASSGLISLAVSTAGLLLVVVYADKVMALFDTSYVGVATILVVLAFGQFITGAVGPAAFLLQATGHEHALLKIYALGTTSAVIGQLVAGYYNDLLLMAVAAACGSAVGSIGACMYAKRVLGIDTTGLFYLYSKIRNHVALG